MSMLHTNRTRFWPALRALAVAALFCAVIPARAQTTDVETIERIMGLRYERMSIYRTPDGDTTMHGPYYSYAAVRPLGLRYEFTGEYWHGRRAGAWTFRTFRLDAEGRRMPRTTISGEYIDGERSGRWTLSEPNAPFGSVVASTEYANGRPTGAFRYAQWNARSPDRSFEVDGTLDQYSVLDGAWTLRTTMGGDSVTFVSHYARGVLLGDTLSCEGRVLNVVNVGTGQQPSEIATLDEILGDSADEYTGYPESGTDGIGIIGHYFTRDTLRRLQSLRTENTKDAFRRMLFATDFGVDADDRESAAKRVGTFLVRGRRTSVDDVLASARSLFRRATPEGNAPELILNGDTPTDSDQWRIVLSHDSSSIRILTSHPHGGSMRIGRCDSVRVAGDSIVIAFLIVSTSGPVWGYEVPANPEYVIPHGGWTGVIVAQRVRGSIGSGPTHVGHVVLVQEEGGAVGRAPDFERIQLTDQDP